MSELSEDNAIARSMGLTYGEYRALTSKQELRIAAPKIPPKKAKTKKKRYSDDAAFLLWQQGKTDAQIGAELGVSRAIIQRWRDNLELPSNSKTIIDTSKYHLIETPYGIYAIEEK